MRPVPDHGDSLVAHSFEQLIARRVLIASGQLLARGAVIGSTTDGHYRLAALGATDGSAQPVAVLAEECDTTGGAAEAFAYFRGHFNARRLLVAEGYTLGAVTGLLAMTGVHVVDYSRRS